MTKLNLLRNAITSNSSFRHNNFKRGLPAFSRDSPRLFSTEAEPPQPQESSPEPFLQTPPTGFAYGKLTGINMHTLKTDIINYLEGSNLSLDDVKIEYNRSSFFPMGMMVQFPSRVAFENAFRVINKKGRLYKLERAQRYQWDTLTPYYNGKAVLLQGIPRNAMQEDIDRFLSGFDYDASAIQMHSRPAFPDPIRMAVVPFPTAVQAMNAFITKNRGYCLNNQILVRVLQ